MRKILLLFIFAAAQNYLLAQAPSNNECDNPIFLPNTENYCSKKGEFSNVGATPSSYGGATCFGTTQNDVWFAFIATTINVAIVLEGNTNQKGGTLQFPAVALYSGDCGGTINELDCDIDKSNSGVASFIKGNLEIGQQYLIRVQATQGKVGTFKLCVNGYNPPKDPTGDCGSASLLCDKTPFVVDKINGIGLVTNEVDLKNAPCFSNGSGNQVESSSTWFKWTCEKAGSLTFDLLPFNETDDLDFVLFELPKGIDDCSEKKLLRCMAAGENASKFPSPCHGPTGLKEGATDISETAGCSTDLPKDNYLKPLDMELGKSYVLIVNNFSDSGLGFSVKFGGVGLFRGPIAALISTSTKKICFGENVTFNDKSTFSNGQITSWKWNFGNGATPKLEKDINVPKPHNVVYNTPGKKYVSLTIESDKGCLVTAIDTFVVDSCCRTKNQVKINPLVTNLKCPDLIEGSIELNLNVTLPTTYKWDFGGTTEVVSGLGSGLYQVTVSNTATCDTVFKFSVQSPTPLATDTLISKPTCNGGADGIITLLAKGGTSPYQFDFGNGYADDNTLKNLPIGLYPIFIKDNNGCLKNVTIDLKELELLLEPTIKAVKPPSCFGYSDGAIVLNVSNGKLPFLYDFGTGFQGNNSINQLAFGKYDVIIQDANLCKGKFVFDIQQPNKLVLATDTVLISCFNEKDGKAIVEAIGGTGAYKYLWSDAQNQTSAEAKNLATGNYTVSVTDENGCVETAIVGLANPPRLDVKPLNIKNVLCYNDRTGEIEFIGQGGRPPYQYSLDGVVFQKGTTFKNLAAGNYSLVVRDTAGCEYDLPLFIKQPSPFIVNAGSDQTVELGEQASIFAETSPAGNNVKSWMWTPDSTLTCKDCPNPIASPFKTITYTIKATDETNCVATDIVTVNVVKNRPVYIPNIFSPGDDNGKNDRFTIYANRAARKIQLIRVFDRWGELVYEGTDIALNDTNQGWNGLFRGQKAAEGIYTYVALIEFIDNEVISYKGDVMLMR